MRLLVFGYADSRQLFDVGAEELEDGFDHYRSSGGVTLGLYRVYAALGDAESVPELRLSRLWTTNCCCAIRIDHARFQATSLLVKLCER
jgi:hypothetical protein